jgi:hypothetical protein
MDASMRLSDAMQSGQRVFVHFYLLSQSSDP